MNRESRMWWVLALLFAVNLLNFFDRQLLGALAEPIRKEFGLNDTAIGLLGTVFTLVYAAAGVPLGRLTDRWTRTYLISIGVAGWSLFTAASGLAWNYASMFVARLGVGIGEAICAPACQSLIGDLFPPRRRASALGIFMLGLPAGLFLAYWLGGMIGEAFGWRAAYLLAFIPGVVVAGLVLLVREPVRGGSEEPGAASPASIRSPYRTVLRIRTLWWIIISGALHNFNMYALTIFLTPFLQRSHGLGLGEANTTSAIVVGVTGFVGLLGGGALADRAGAHRVDGRLLLSAGAMLLAAPCVFLALLLPAGSVPAFILLMGTGVTLIYTYYPTVYASILDVVEPRLRGTAVAIYFFAMYVLGGSFGSIVTGGLSDIFAQRAMRAAGANEMTETFRAAGLHGAMYVIPILVLGCALVLFMSSRTISADMRRREHTLAPASSIS